MPVVKQGSICRDGHSASRLLFVGFPELHSALVRDLADIGGDRGLAKCVSTVYQEQASSLPITLPENRA